MSKYVCTIVLWKSKRYLIRNYIKLDCEVNGRHVYSDYVFYLIISCRLISPSSKVKLHRGICKNHSLAKIMGVVYCNHWITQSFISAVLNQHISAPFILGVHSLWFSTQNWLFVNQIQSKDCMYYTAFWLLIGPNGEFITGNVLSLWTFEPHNVRCCPRFVQTLHKRRHTWNRNIVHMGHVCHMLHVSHILHVWLHQSRC